MIGTGLQLGRLLGSLEKLDPMLWTGRVTEIVGLLVESEGPSTAIGDFCEIRHQRGTGLVGAGSGWIRRTD